MKLPRTETTLAAMLLLAAAPFALAAPPGANGPPNSMTNTPSVAPPPASGSQSDQSQDMQSGSSTMGSQGSSTSSQSNGGSMSSQSGSPMSSSGWSQSKMGMSSAMVPKADIQAAKDAKVSLTQAIDAVQQQNQGAKVVGAKFELRQGKPEYLIRTYDSQKQQEMLCHVSAETGQMVGNTQTVPLQNLEQEDRHELTAAQNVNTTLTQAVQKTEQHSGGKALAARLTMEDGMPSYRTELLKSDGRTQVAMVNPKSGEVSSYR